MPFSKKFFHRIKRFMVMIHQHPGWLDSRLKFIDINIFGKVNGKNALSIYFRQLEVGGNCDALLKKSENHRATLNGTEPSLVSLVTPVKEARKGPNFCPIWLLCIEPIPHMKVYMTLLNYYCNKTCIFHN